jgi:hypothetical protein
MIKVPLLRHQRYKSIPTHSPTVKPTTECTRKNVDFDTFDGHVMVNFIEPNLQDIIFTLSTVSLTFEKMTFYGEHPLVVVVVGDRKFIGFCHVSAV